ncbi:MAG: sigma-54-dependent Fis family transcriptional regulator [Zetaproteobacteria bacterium]|nr:MAG: sigma-54-dependent Fis family transcriptional regulator [Zetaproteobacteria bacterium]
MHLLLVGRDGESTHAMVGELQQAGHYVTRAGGVLQARELFGQGRFDAALIHTDLPDGEGLALLGWIGREHPDTACILCSDDRDPTLPVEAFRAGAADFLHIPPLPGQVAARLAALPAAGAAHRAVPESGGRRAGGEGAAPPGGAVELIGESPAIVKLRGMIERLHDADSTVLITGESGTGKEVVARALHRHGRRAMRPFVSINCGAIPEELLESELFGHVKGAFTGAVRSRQGRFAVANGGTIFLDEIGDMSPKLQVKLLRVLQERCFEPVGSHESIHVDVRVIAATHRDLEQAIDAGTFRQDLFYRLNVIPLELPPLRARGDDLFLLADHFIRLFNRRLSANITGIDEQARAAMRAHRWPGNVRELQNLIERVATLKQEGVITLEDLPSRMLNREQRLLQEFLPRALPEEEAIDYRRLVDDFERHLLLMALDRFGWNKNRAAAFLSMNRTTLFEKIKKKGLTPPREE